METFFLVWYFSLRDIGRLCCIVCTPAIQSETLKYLYLLFSDSKVMPLDGALQPASTRAVFSISRFGVVG